MIKQPNMKMIGLFVVISVLSLVLMFGYFFKSRFNDNDATVVMFFDESVQGLDVGAPVLFKGVKIGEVTSVKLIFNLKKRSSLISVYAKIYGDKSLVTDTTDENERLKRFIEDGLRAQLEVNSIITGQLLIELDLRPDTKVILHPEEARHVHEIPTIASPIEELSKSLQEMPISKIVQDIHHITQTLDTNLPPLLEEMTATVKTLGELLGESKSGTPGALGQINKTATDVGKMAQTLDNFVGENSSSISAMIESFSAAAVSLKNLTDYLQINPSSIVTGKGK